MHYIGMDVHKKLTTICILDDCGKIVREKAIKGYARDVLAYLKSQRQELGGVMKVCYEASGGCGWLHDELVKLGFVVQVAHPGKLRLIFQSRRKNDRVDARKLAKLLYLDEVPLAYVPTAAIRQWRSLIEFRHKLVIRRSAAKHRLRALLHDHGVVAPRGLWTKNGLSWLAAQELAPEPALQRDMLLEELDSAGGQIKRVEKLLASRAAQEPGVALLMTIPGVGIRTAEAVLVYIADATRFRRNRSVGCYFGMVPCEDSSVKSRFGHITKEGPGLVRWLVTEAAWQSIRRDPSIKAYYQRICHDDRDRRKIALVATAHHLLRVMHAMLSSGEAWRRQAA